MKVALFGPSKSIHTHKWAVYFKNQGHEVKVITFANHFSKENAQEVDTITLPETKGGKLGYLLTVPALKGILQSWKPDIFHAHFISSYGFVGALTGYKPFFVSVWGKDIFDFPKSSGINRKIIEFTLARANVVMSTSHIMAKETNLYTNKKIWVTPFGVDTTKFRPALMQQEKSEQLRVGTVKALSDKYGIADLVKGFASLHTRFPESELVIAGDGPQRKEYEELASSLGIADAVTFMGKIPHDQVPLTIQSMDIFAVPSTENSESFGVAAVEAMACGVPVVVSNVGGLPEVVVAGETGIVIDKESPDQLAEALIRLATSSELRGTMSRQGVEHVAKHYDWIKNANYMESLYIEYMRGELK
ncbi:glycosyltransferase [Chryseomicrobium aureum]|uniref:glycosyltransferase n=1 Tax=Chryseomicrobium aureum TaxID=1441723 RepID=UPI00370CFBFB